MGCWIVTSIPWCHCVTTQPQLCIVFQHAAVSIRDVGEWGWCCLPQTCTWENHIPIHSIQTITTVMQFKKKKSVITLYCRGYCAIVQLCKYLWSLLFILFQLPLLLIMCFVLFSAYLLLLFLIEALCFARPLCYCDKGNCGSIRGLYEFRTAKVEIK